MCAGKTPIPTGNPEAQRTFLKTSSFFLTLSKQWFSTYHCQLYTQPRATPHWGSPHWAIQGNWEAEKGVVGIPAQQLVKAVAFMSWIPSKMQHPPQGAGGISWLTSGWSGHTWLISTPFLARQPHFHSRHSIKDAFLCFRIGAPKLLSSFSLVSSSLGTWFSFLLPL
jgi:hypothetical protein